MNDTTLTLVGNVVNDVVLRYTKSGHAVASFRVAHGTRRFDRNTGAWVDSDTHFFNVTMWREFAQNAADSIKKGMPVVVYGKLRSREIPRTFGDVTINVVVHDIEAFAVGPNIARGTATFTRQLRAAVTENDVRATADEIISDEERGTGFDDEPEIEVDLETGEIRPLTEVAEPAA